MRDSLPDATQSGHGDISIFYGHGQYDPVIPIDQAESSRRFLEESGYTVEWHSYPMEHSVSAKEIAHIKIWLSSVLS
jgi:phospholipase/carboxylesterase